MGNNVASTLEKVAEAQSTREIVFRPQGKPVPRVLCSVRSAGHYRVAAPWKEMVRVKDFWEIFWTIRGRGQFGLADGETQEVHGNTFFWYHSGEEHRMEPAETGGEWEYCWLTLDGPGTGQLLEQLDMPRCRAGRPCPESLFRQLMHQLQDTTPDGMRACSVTAYRILLEAAAAEASPASRGAEPLAEKVRERIERDFTDTGFSIETLSRELEVHRSTLYRVFRRVYGVSPSSYLQDRRVQRGLSLLRESGLPVGLVAYASGFTDSNYFSKLIRKVTRQSPAEFRKG